VTFLGVFWRGFLWLHSRESTGEVGGCEDAVGTVQTIAKEASKQDVTVGLEQGGWIQDVPGRKD
jgi:hypothetical protein